MPIYAQLIWVQYIVLYMFIASAYFMRVPMYLVQSLSIWIFYNKRTILYRILFIFFVVQGFGLFGTRGKKVPVDFRGKFVGVRGKKVPVGMALRDLVAARGGEYTMPELQSGAHLETGVDGESSKRAPSGFHGMRGKKWSSSSPLQTGESKVFESGYQSEKHCGHAECVECVGQRRRDG